MISHPFFAPSKYFDFALHTRSSIQTSLRNNWPFVQTHNYCAAARGLITCLDLESFSPWSTRHDVSCWVKTFILLKIGKPFRSLLFIFCCEEMFEEDRGRLSPIFKLGRFMLRYYYCRPYPAQVYSSSGQNYGNMETASVRGQYAKWLYARML
jgi:hypothetical protein